MPAKKKRISTCGLRGLKRNNACLAGWLTKLDDDLTKVIGMSGDLEETHVADRTVTSMFAAETVLLHVGHCLHDQADRVQDYASNVSARAECRMRELSDIWRVEHSHRQRDGPHPEHLEDPEAKEFEEIVALVVEAIIFARLQDPEEEKARQPCAPDHNEERADNVARDIAVFAPCQRDDGQDDEVGTPGEVGELVEFETERNGEEEQLVSYSDEPGDGEIIVVQHMDWTSHDYYLNVE